MTQCLIRLYALLLRLYPRQFHRKFGDEMHSVFAETITAEPGIKSATLFLRELFDLPGSILSVCDAQWFRGGNMATQNEYIVPSTRWQALIGTLPFLAFGIVSMIGKIDQFNDPQDIYLNLVFYILVLSGLLIGWVRGFPLWSYSYLGWSLVFAWWWTNTKIYGTDWGYRVWLPFGIMVLLALLWTRSLEPLKKLLRDIWNDWTRLSLAMFTLGALIFMGGGEDHHPQWLLFLLAATSIICIGAWCFLRSSSLIGRVLSIAISFIASAVPMGISYLTWDWRTHYGLPPSDDWLDNLGVAPVGVLFWLLIIFWPALIALIQRITTRRITSQ